MERLDAARCLLISVGLVIAGSAAAQSSGKAPAATSAQGSTKSAPAKATAAPKSLDFVPSTSTKDTAATRTAAPVAAQPAQSPVKDRSNCHSSASDA